jgi:predicted  nucleic acid-binding Zn-ribbon protein
MRVMKMHWAVLAVLLVRPSEAAAQTPQATPLPPPNGDSIIQELRLLRQAIERHGRGSAQVQLLLGHLTLQDQRAARTQDAADRLDDEGFALEQQRRRLEAEVRDVTRALEQAKDEGRRADLDLKLRSARARLDEKMAFAARVESRRTRARQAASEEQARYRDLDAKLAEFERELGRDVDPLR